jgi:cytochrome c oxidase assembly factor 2
VGLQVQTSNNKNKPVRDGAVSRADTWPAKTTQHYSTTIGQLSHLFPTGKKKAARREGYGVYGTHYVSYHFSPPRLAHIECPKSHRMALPQMHVFRLTSRRARSLTSSLFGITFFACFMTVCASDMLPCPAHPKRGRFADGDDGVSRHSPSVHTPVMEKGPRRWIEERYPSSRDV